MKNVLLIFACLSGAQLAEANGYASQIHLHLYDNAPIAVTFDNQRYNTPSNNYQLTNITPGNHYLQVSRMVQYGQGWGSYTMPVTVYQGWVTVPAASNITAMINGMNQYSVLSVTPLYSGPSYGNPNDPWGSYDPYGGGNGGGCGNGNNGYGNGGYGNNGYGGYGYYGIPSADFEALKNSIRNKSFDDTRLTVAKQGIRNGITASQVTELVNLMTFESTKLALAKHAYSFTADKHNYHLVSNAFSFESSTTELAQYVSTH
ncbi:MAG: hypothetical protein FD123_1410 [Bacteroidetes bacterium]|nr:MAG: hypothetical protein FD123_1410 [Bacteroidota bacterium]